MSRRIACFLILLLAAGSLSPLRSQDQNDTLTEDEVQQIRDNAIHPDDRIKLYTKFINQRLDEIKHLSADPKADNYRTEMRSKFEEFTHLCDELQDNLDTYDVQHADIRKSLKDLVASTAKWPDVLKAVPDDPTSDFSRTTALEAAKSATEQAKQLSIEQDVYFQTHKDERHKNGTGPN
jgi:hypothetical protein